MPTLKHLNYTPCYPGFQCARLELPLDHFNGTTNANISPAVTRKPAAVNVTSEKYGGTIMFNSGGLGGFWRVFHAQCRSRLGNHR